VPAVERVVTSGVFTLDGQSFGVDNNVWLYGNEDEVLIVDAAHDAAAIAEAVDGRRVSVIVCTHGHNDHVNAAVALADLVKAPIALHPADRMLWEVEHPTRQPDVNLVDGQRLGDLVVAHTPGHSPGGVCLIGAGVVFSGDTLFRGGPGATGRSFSDFPAIIGSIRERLLPLPADTVVHTGHGDDTTIGDEAPHLDEWIARGH
jgi:glyoxylase-like metal-dependent hydrolase (beta-lactamase superfamily II)